MKKEIVSTAAAPKAVGAYSQGVRIEAARLWYFSGQIAIDPATGSLVDGDAAAQASRIIANIAALLADQGLTAANVVKTSIFLTDIADFQAVNAVYAGFFAEALPARSCVAVSALPLGANVEIEVIAAE